MSKKDNWVVGIHAVEALLNHENSASVKQLCLQSGRSDKRFQSLQSRAEQLGLSVRWLDKQALERTVGDIQHQGVAAEVSQLRQWQESDIPALLEQSACPFILILDGVTDPHNLGACLRSANGAGVDFVITPKDKAAGITATARKVASGAAEETPLIRVTNLARTIRKLKEQGVWVVGLADQRAETLYETDLTGPKALILGAEGKGLRNLTQELCDYLVSIPMFGGVSSLNVSVATGVCLYEAVRQRQKPDK